MTPSTRVTIRARDQGNTVLRFVNSPRRSPRDAGWATTGALRALRAPRAREACNAALVVALMLLASGCATPARPLDADELARLTQTNTPSTGAVANAGRSHQRAAGLVDRAGAASDGAAGASSSHVSSAAPILSGTYEATVWTRWLGPLRTNLIVEPLVDEQGRVGGFKANTRPGVAWGLVGGVEGTLGSLLAPFIFPRGMLLTWENALPGGGRVEVWRVPDEPPKPGADTPVDSEDTTSEPPAPPPAPELEGSIGIGSLNMLRARTRLVAPAAGSGAAPLDLRALGLPDGTIGPFEILTREGRAVAALTLRRVDQSERSASREATERSVLAGRAFDAARLAWYDPIEARSEAFDAFGRDLREGAARAGDDVELLLVSVLAARKHLENLVPLLYRAQDDQGRLVAEAVLPAGRRSSQPFLVTRDEARGIVTLRLDAAGFGSDPRQGVALMRRAWRTALNARPDGGLIVDLRLCAGLDEGALLMAAPLLRSGIEAGRVVAGPARGLLSDKVEPGEKPRRVAMGEARVAPARLAALDARTTSVTLNAAPDQAAEAIGAPGSLSTIDTLASDGRVVALRIEPGALDESPERPLRFDGPVVVLVSPRTESMGVVLSDVMRRAGARVMGEPTPTRAVLWRERDAGDGWRVRVPWGEVLMVSTRVGPDEPALLSRGVRPDQRTSRDETLDAAKAWLRTRQRTREGPREGPPQPASGGS